MKSLLFLLLVFSLNAWSQIALPVQQSVLPKNSLVLNYDFSNTASYTRGSSTVTNLAGNAVGNSTLLNNPIFINSLGFISFNGTNQYVVTPNLKTYFKSVDATTVQKSFTVSFWIYPTDLNSVVLSELDSQTPSSGWHASNIEIVNGVVKYRVYPGTVAITSSAIMLNQWYHIALVYTGATAKGYLNGVLQGSQTYAREAPSASQNYAIGATEATNMGTSAYGKFSLAQFKLYHLPLTDSDILQEYNVRKGEFDYMIHSPSTNSNPTYWSISSAWNYVTGASGAYDAFGVYHFTPWLNSDLGWAAQALDANQYITLNYEEPAYVKGVVIQPRASSGNQYVTKVHVETSLTGAAPWTRVLTDQTIGTNITDDARVLFSSSVYTKALKVIPVTWTNHISMRMGMLVKPNTPVTDGLVLNLDAANIKSYQGTGSTWSDLSSSLNHATISQSPTYNAGIGLTFNGSTQYGRIPSVAGVTDFTNTQKYSIEVWFNPSNGQANNAEAELLEKWNYSGEAKYPFTIRFNESGSSMMVACYDGSSNYPSLVASGFPVNTWVQLVAVFDFVSNTLTIYRNGVSVASRSLTGINQVSNSGPVGIAGRIPQGAATGVQVPFKGTIGIIRFYNKSLTSAEILQNFNTYKTRYGL